MTSPGNQSWQSFQQATNHQNHISSQLSHQNATRAAENALHSSRRQAQYHHPSGRSGGSFVGRLFGRVLSLAFLAFAFLVVVELAERAGVDLISLVKDLF